MKNTFLIIFFSLTFLNQTLAQDTGSLIAKIWRCDAESTFNSLPQEKREKLEDIEKEWHENLSKIKMEFKKDGSYNITGKDPNPKQGKWELSEDGKTLIMTEDSGHVMTSPILELSSSKLVLFLANAKLKMVYITAE